ncbi:DNA helicase [Tanacetum coccineum]|uniref:ATP-dependent DNA helicase n=1 Tax=Tanacetum coccineum TaxID=301880 RepID=A0ABQ5FY29_9ASTR
MWWHVATVRCLLCLTTLGLARFEETVGLVEPPARRVNPLMLKQTCLRSMGVIGTAKYKTEDAGDKEVCVAPVWITTEVVPKKVISQVQDLQFCTRHAAEGNDLRETFSKDNTWRQKETYTPNSAKANLVERLGPSSRAVDMRQKHLYGQTCNCYDIKVKEMFFEDDIREGSSWGLCLDYGNSDVRYASFEPSNTVICSENYVGRGPMVLDFEKCVVRSVGGDTELVGVEACVTSSANFSQQRKIHGVCKRQEQKHARSLTVGNGGGEFGDVMLDTVNHGGVTDSYIDICDCHWVCEYRRAAFWYGERVKRGGRLFQQYVVGVFCCIEQNRLDFCRLRQNDIRREYLLGVYDAICRGDREGSEIGGRLILPRTFTDGPHYMYSHYLDALAICRALGNPQYFITFTCNANWPEIKRHMQPFPELTPADRADIVVHVFEQKVQDFCNFLKDVQLFGYVTGHAKDKIQNASEIDRRISVGKDRQSLTSIVNDDSKTKTTLTEWLEYNKFNKDGLHLTYIDFTKEFVWYPNSRSWRRRQRRTAVSIGRLANVHPASGELLFLWMLLCHQKGCKTFQYIRTVNKRLYPTFRSACATLGLLGDNKEWHTALEESAFSATSQQLRTLFAQILIFYLYMNDPELEGGVLYELEVILNTFSKTVTDFGLPPLSKKFRDAVRNKELMEEKSYNRIELSKEIALLVPKLNTEQRNIYETTLINTLRSQGKIVLPVASSGIASLLLPAGRTAHSRFKLPLDLTEESLCNIKKNTHVASLLAETNLIIWDESPMNDKKYFETLDRTLKDILDVPHKLFGGKTIVLGGDFRQTLPVKKGASKLEIPGLTEHQKRRAAEFASWLLEIGDGKIGTVEDSSEGDCSWVTIPEQYYLPDDATGLQDLIGFIYDEKTLQQPTAGDLQQKAIVCPKNSTADEINTMVLRMLHGESKVYSSSDEAIPVGSDRGEVELLYPPEYLNTLQFSGFRPHEQELKVGAPIMLLRNMNLQGGMYSMPMCKLTHTDRQWGELGGVSEWGEGRVKSTHSHRDFIRSGRVIVDMETRNSIDIDVGSVLELERPQIREIFFDGRSDDLYEGLVGLIGGWIDWWGEERKKDQILLDEETALKLQAVFDEEEILAKEKAKKVQEANIALIKT